MKFQVDPHSTTDDHAAAFQADELNDLRTYAQLKNITVSSKRSGEKKDGSANTSNLLTQEMILEAPTPKLMNLLGVDRAAAHEKFNGMKSWLERVLIDEDVRLANSKDAKSKLNRMVQKFVDDDEAQALADSETVGGSEKTKWVQDYSCNKDRP